MTPFYKILNIQGEVKVQMVLAGMDQKVAHKLAGEFVQMWIDSGLLSKEVQEELDAAIVRSSPGK